VSQQPNTLHRKVDIFGCLFSRRYLSGATIRPPMEPNVCVDTESLTTEIGKVLVDLDGFQHGQQARYAHAARE
jgi:hypothetical protein